MQILLFVLGGIIILVYGIPIFERAFNFGSAVGIIWGAAVLAEGAFWDKISFTGQKYAAFFTALSVFAVVWAGRFICSFGRDNTQSGDAVIVLGCRVRGDVPSIALEKRVDACFMFLMSNPDAKAILSGGQGADENISEAQCMKNLLVYRGIDPERLYIEDASVSTRQNIAFSKKLMEENKIEGSVVICTSEYHQLRAKKICGSMGLDCRHISSQTKRTLLASFLMREIFALVRERIRK